MIKLTKANLWSKKEIDLLKQLYPTKTAQQIADKIGRTVGTVRLRAFKLGLKKRQGFKAKK